MKVEKCPGHIGTCPQLSQALRLATKRYKNRRYVRIARIEHYIQNLRYRSAYLQSLQAQRIQVVSYHNTHNIHIRLNERYEYGRRYIAHKPRSLGREASAPESYLRSGEPIVTLPHANNIKLLILLFCAHGNAIKLTVSG